MQDDRNYQTYVSEVGRRIKAYRISKGLSQQDIEDMTGAPKKDFGPQLSAVRNLRISKGIKGKEDYRFRVL